MSDEEETPRHGRDGTGGAPAPSGPAVPPGPPPDEPPGPPPDEPPGPSPDEPSGPSPDSGSPSGSPRQHRFFGPGFAILAAITLLALFWTRDGGSKVVELKWHPEFTDLVDFGFVRDVEIVRGDETSVGKGVVEISGPGTALVGEDAVAALRKRFPDKTPFRVRIGNADDAQRFLESHSGVSVSIGHEDGRLALFLLQFLPVILLIGGFYWISVKQMRGAGGPFGFGKSRVRQVGRGGDASKTTFKDVAGCDEAKEEVVEVVEYLKDPKKFGRLGGKMPHGLLMAGPPGTGKTLLAKAIAGEAGVPFFSISGSDFVEMFVGVGASRVRDLFEQAKRNSPCLVFIDEIDAVGRRRGAGIGGGHDEREQTLNQLLVQMDGFETNAGIVVIAATNRPDVLDPALLRPGRFDRQIVVDLPTMNGRLEILKVHAAKVKLAEGTDLSKIARGTPGCSGADLANIVNEAALLASRAEKPGVDEDDLEAARDKVLWGKERRSHALDEEEKRLTAYHEAGHAVCAILDPAADPVHKVTVIPRGRALGITAFLPKKDKYHYSRANIRADLVVAMGGRTAEELFLPDVSTGASQDLRQATQLAHSYVCDWGLDGGLGPRTFGKNEDLVFLGAEVNRTRDYSEKTAERIDEAVSRLLEEAHERARESLSTHREAVEALVAALLEKETVDGDEAEFIVRNGRRRADGESVPSSPTPEPPPLPESPPEAPAAAGDQSSSTPAG